MYRDVIVVRFWLYFNYLERFSKILKCQVSCKFVHWQVSCSMRTERRTDGPIWR